MLWVIPVTDSIFCRRSTMSLVPLLSAVKDYIEKRVSYNVITRANPFCPTADIISPHCGGSLAAAGGWRMHRLFSPPLLSNKLK